MRVTAKYSPSSSMRLVATPAFGATNMSDTVMPWLVSPTKVLVSMD